MPTPQVYPTCARISHDRLPYFALLTLTIVLLAILRSAITTRFDSFTADENYHVVAGVSYFRTGDYRINPEHPPLVKLWVGAFIPESVLHLPPLKIFNDKSGERTYAAETVYLKNDPDRIQRYARFAMYCFNGILLFVFALVARRVFGDAIALGALIFLAIDPTVAAHMPVVMTDLPVTLIGAIALLSAWLAFKLGNAPPSPAPRSPSASPSPQNTPASSSPSSSRSSASTWPCATSPRRTRKFLRAHSNAPPQARPPRRSPRRRLRRSLEHLSLPLPRKPLRTRNLQPLTHRQNRRSRIPIKRYVLTTIARLHIVPRAFLWGFADIIRKASKASGFPLYFRDHIYIEQKPLYYFPFQLLVKIPIGLSALLLRWRRFFFFARNTPPEHRPQFWFFVLFFLFFLTTIATSHSQYAGVRHALPLYATLAFFAGAAFAFVMKGRGFVQAGLPRQPFPI